MMKKKKRKEMLRGGDCKPVASRERERKMNESENCLPRESLSSLFLFFPRKKKKNNDDNEEDREFKYITECFSK